MKLNPNLKRIAVEEAFVTEDIAKEWKNVLASKFVEPGFRMMGNSILGEDPGARLVHSRLVDVGAGRIAQMDADGIDVAVLSITSPGVQAFDAVTATRLAKDANDVLLLHFLQGAGGDPSRVSPNFGERSAQARARSQDHGPFDKILQFPHVPGPRPTDERAHRLQGNFVDLLAHFPGIFLREVPGKDGYILETVAQGRQSDRENI